MSSLSTKVRGGISTGGEVISYPAEQLYQEIAYVAYYFHWQREDILNLEHFERQKWIAEIEKIQQ
jgi:hypothetical protein